MNRFITSSWDDGHPKDLRLAEMLAKYTIPATFYIPKTNTENVVMDEAAMLELSRSFEIGGHTLNHTRLNIPPTAAEQEINGCYQWITDITGSKPLSFCFPGGVYNKDSINIARKSGYKVLRTTELLSVDLPASNGLMPTTLQLYKGSALRYTKHLVKRLKFESLRSWSSSGFETDMLRLTDYYLQTIEEKGGCFHLWGHSWEIEKFGLWTLLENILKQLQSLAGFTYLQNKDIINY